MPEAADTSVIVNEVGAIGLDGALLAEGGDIPVMLLGNGCICCSLGGDLERSLARLMAARGRAGLPPPRRIVLETSGVSKPGPILRQLAALPTLDLRAAVVATFDCTRGTAVAAFEEAAAQWAGAQALVLTKRDLVGAEGLERARTAVRGVNPLATLIESDDPADPFRLTGSRPTRFEATELPAHIAHPRIRPLIARFHAPVLWDDVAEFLDNLAGFLGERLLRVKGVVQAAGTPMLVQSVGTTFSAPRPFPRWHGESFLVVIVRDIDDTPPLSALAPGLPIVIEGWAPSD